MPATAKPNALPENLPRAHILRHRSDFQRIRRDGKRVSEQFLMLNWLKSDEDHARRVGVIVPKAVGNAVGRNRVKRRIREIYRRNQNQLPSHLQSVWVARKGAAEADFSTFQTVMLKLYRKAGLIAS